MLKNKDVDTSLESIAQFQVKVWSHFLSSAQHTSNIFKEQLINKPLGLVDATINYSLNTQSAFARSLQKDFETTTGGDSIPLNKWVRHSMDNAEMWSDAQRQIWNTWMDAVRSLEANYPVDEYVKRSNDQFQGIRDMTRKTVNVQTEWFLRLLQGLEDAESEANLENKANPRSVADVKHTKNAA